MRVALFTTFRASRKDPLAGELERIHAAFLAGPGAPAVRFVMADAPMGLMTSGLDRVLKRFPQMKQFLAELPPYPGGPPIRQIRNGPMSPAPGEQMDFATLVEIATGVPRSFPIHNIAIHFQHPAFGEMDGPMLIGGIAPGVIVSDSWWVNGRQRSVSAYTIVEGDQASKKLPPLPEPVASVLAACGKVKSTTQVPFASPVQTSEVAAGPDPEAVRKAGEVIGDYKARYVEILEQIVFPHELPPTMEVLRSSLGLTSGPKKPVLQKVFKPLGYDCKGESGTFTLRRRTAGNLTVELSLDVGTWSNSYLGHYKLHGLGFRTVLALPVAKHALRAQYPIGDAERWQKIVENLGAVVAHLDRTLVPDVEKAAGPSPDWYTPES